MISQLRTLGQKAYGPYAKLWRAAMRLVGVLSHSCSALRAYMVGVIGKLSPQQDERVIKATFVPMAYAGALATSALFGSNPIDARIRCWSHGRRRRLVPTGT